MKSKIISVINYSRKVLCSNLSTNYNPKSKHGLPSSIPIWIRLRLAFWSMGSGYIIMILLRIRFIMGKISSGLIASYRIKNFWLKLNLWGNYLRPFKLWPLPYQLMKLSFSRTLPIISMILIFPTLMCRNCRDYLQRSSKYQRSWLSCSLSKNTGLLSPFPILFLISESLHLLTSSISS